MRVVGIGNRWRSDDGVGLEVAARVRALDLKIDVVERDGEPVAVLDAIEGAGAVVVVDAVSSGATPGTLHRLDASTTPLAQELFNRSTTHHLGLPEAVELGRALGRLPDTLVVIGVEGESWAAGEQLSAPVAAALDGAVAAVLEEVERCTSRP